MEGDRHDKSVVNNAATANVVAVLNENDSLGRAKRRKRSESELCIKINNSDDDGNALELELPASKRVRETSTASSNKPSESNLPIASSVDQYLQSPHRYAPRPEWCNPARSNHVGSSSSSAHNADEQFGIASNQNAIAADQAAAARMDAVAAFENAYVGSIQIVRSRRNNNANVGNQNANDDNAHDQNGENPPAEANAAIPLAAVAQNVNMQNRRRAHLQHHRRRDPLQQLQALPPLMDDAAQQQVRNAIGNIQAIAQRIRRDIRSVPAGLSAHQRDIIRGIMGGQPVRIGQLDIAAINQILRTAPRQAAEALNLDLRREQQRPALQPQPPQPVQQGEHDNQEQQQDELPQRDPLHAQQLYQRQNPLLPPDQDPPLPLPRLPIPLARGHETEGDDQPSGQSSKSAEGGDAHANESKSTPIPGKISVFGTDLDSLLHLAIKRGAVDAALDLIEGGACIDFPNAKGITPLMVSSQEGNAVIVRALLNKGAKPNKTTIRGTTPLIQACHFGRYDVVEELLKHGALVDLANNKNTTALMRASQEGHDKVVKLLIKHDAVINRRNDERMTALMLCSQRGHSGIVKLLIKAGADVDAKTSQDSTSLMLACKRKNLEVAKILVAAGSELRLKDGKNRTVLETATRRGNTDFARLLTDKSQVRLIKEETRRERNFCMIRLSHLLNWERATIRILPRKMTVHEVTEDLSNPILQFLCPSKRTLVRAMTLPAPVIELITAFIPLPLCWEKRIRLLSSRCHVDPDSAVSNTLDLIDEVIEEGGILEAFDAAGMSPPTSFLSWVHFRAWCGRCDVILSRCQNEDISNIFAQDVSGNKPRHVESAQTQRRRANYLLAMSRAPNTLAEVLASPPYQMPSLLLEKLRSNGDLQSLARRLASGVHFECKFKLLHLHLSYLFILRLNISPSSSFSICCE